MGCGLSVTNHRNKVGDFYLMGKLISTGSFGHIYECLHRQTEIVYTVKITTRSYKNNGYWSNRNVFYREVDVLKYFVNEPFIVQYVDSYTDDYYYYIITKYYRGKQLLNYINDCGLLSENKIRDISIKLLQAITVIHSKKIIHRDIKAENFVFETPDPDSNLILLDFGMAIKQESIEETATDACGSACYLAPEIINRKCNLKADLWAVGVIIYLLFYHRYPFNGTSTKSILNRILNEPVDYNMNTGTPISQEAIEFLRGLLHKDSEARLTAEQALNHKWLNEKSSDLISSTTNETVSTVDTENFFYTNSYKEN